jgi:hypothetical protein
MPGKLNVDQAVLAILGAIVVISVLLAWYAHPAWLWLTLLTGLHMLQIAFTGFCPMARMLEGQGFRRGAAL